MRGRKRNKNDKTVESGEKVCSLCACSVYMLLWICDTAAAAVVHRRMLACPKSRRIPDVTGRSVPARPSPFSQSSTFGSLGSEQLEASSESRSGHFARGGPSRSYLEKLKADIHPFIPCIWRVSNLLQIWCPARTRVCVWNLYKGLSVFVNHIARRSQGGLKHSNRSNREPLGLR